MSENRVLNGRYELTGLLGRGGMADVYLGKDVRLGRPVAVKLLRSDLARDPQFQARFRREAQAVAGLNHPSIVAVYDTGESIPELESDDATRIPYIVMEYVQGKTLRDLIKSGGVTLDHAIDYTLGVLSALEYSHRAGIVHRDIKPANVMVTQDGTGVKVMDFGIARALADSAATMTQTQAVVGTAQYLSPEQARGENVDTRSDLYSAACLCYELLTGRPPFIGDSPVSVAYQHVRETPAPPSKYNSDVTPALDSVLAKALAKDREDRFQDAAAFRRSLRAAKAGVSLGSAKPPTGNTDELYRRDDAGAHLSKVSVAAAPEDQDPAGPPTRAMAKIMAGGPLTTGEPTDEPAEDFPLDRMGHQEPDKATVRRRRGWIITLVILAIVLVAGGGYLIFNSLAKQNAAPPQVQVPSVAGQNEADAISTLYNAQLKPNSVEKFSDTVQSGQVIGTNPAANSSVPQHSNVEVDVSKGPASATVPGSVVGMTESSARDALRTANLQPGSTTMVDSPTVPAGQVISTDPATGTSVPANSTVNLSVSTGKVKLPALYDKTRQEAEDALKKAAPLLNVTFEEQENSQVPPGTVVAEVPDAGTEVDQSADITVRISKAKPAPPTSAPPTSSASPSCTGADCGKK